ncbi:uncharacterized protein ACBT57_019369 [Dama dama]
MRQMTRVTVLLTLGTLSLAKTSQPIFIDSYEGQEVNISCNHTTIATNDYIFWYRHFPNQGPQYIIQGYKTNVENEVASLFIPTDRKREDTGAGKQQAAFVKRCARGEHSLWGGALSPAEVSCRRAPIQPSGSHGLCAHLDTWDSVYAQWTESSVGDSARRSGPCRGRGSSDCEVHLFSVGEPLSFLVCPTSQSRSPVPSEIHRRGQVGSRQLWI